LFIPYTSDCEQCKFRLDRFSLRYNEARKRVVGSGKDRIRMPSGNNPQICSNGAPRFLRPSLRPGKCGKMGAGPGLDAIGLKEGPGA
jgi:hypothetical protein